MEGSNSNLRAATVACALLLCAALAPVHADDHIVLLNWSDYIDQALIEEFTAETGIRVEEVFYSSDSDRDAILARSEPGEFDVVIVSGDRLDLLVSSGWLAPMSEREVPNAVHVDEEWRQKYPSAHDYSLPMTWGDAPG